MKPAVIVVDMLKDVLAGGHSYPIVAQAEPIVPAINGLTDHARQRGWPVVFACDSFLADDFIFKSRMKPHCLRGTVGAEPIDELRRAPSDVILPKRRFSAFFKTDLDQTLRTAQVDTVVVCGISTHVCVLTTALDAVAHDFSAIVVEDATASYDATSHQHTLDLYRKSPLRPLLQVMAAAQVMASPS